MLWGIVCPKGTMAKQPVSLRSPLGVHQCHPLGERFSESLSTLPGIGHCQHAPLDSLDLPFSLFFSPKMGETVTFENKEGEVSVLRRHSLGMSV